MNEFSKSSGQFIFVKTLREPSGQINKIEFSSDDSLMIVSAEKSVDIYTNNNNQINHLQSIPFPNAFSRKASISQNKKYLVINDFVAVSPAFRIYIYTFNESTKLFDEPVNKDKFRLYYYAYYGSLSEDNQYLTISIFSTGITSSSLANVNKFTLVYSSPLSESPILEQ